MTYLIFTFPLEAADVDMSMRKESFSSPGAPNAMGLVPKAGWEMKTKNY